MIVPNGFPEGDADGRFPVSVLTFRHVPRPIPTPFHPRILWMRLKTTGKNPPNLSLTSTRLSTGILLVPVAVLPMQPMCSERRH